MPRSFRSAAFALLAITGGLVARQLWLAQKSASARTSLLNKALRQVEFGRRLAMYDRETGLSAFWYLEKRFLEESGRSFRYQRPLALITIDLDLSGGFEVQDRLTHWLKKHLRSSDLACHSGSGRFLLLLPEAAPYAVVKLSQRVLSEFGEIPIGWAHFPDEGLSLQQLVNAAVERSARPATKPHSL